MKIIPRIVITERMTRSAEKAALANLHASSFDFTVKCSVKRGMNAAERAPSPRSLLSRFGILKATKKASVANPAPNIFAITISLMNPKIRLKNVPLLIIPVALSNFSFSDIRYESLLL